MPFVTPSGDNRVAYEVAGTDLGSDYVAWLKSVIPQAEYEVWPDYGHYPHLLDPNRFVEQILSMR